MIWTALRVALAIPVAAAVAGLVFGAEMLMVLVATRPLQIDSAREVVAMIAGAVILGGFLAFMTAVFVAMHMAAVALPVWFVLDRLRLTSRWMFAGVGAIAGPAGAALFRQDSLATALETTRENGVLVLLAFVLPGAAAGVVLNLAAYGIGSLRPPPARPS